MGLRLRGGKNTYKPAEDTLLVTQHLDFLMGRMHLIDVGTGSGILALLLAREGRYVIAIDVLEDAVKAAQANSELNGLDGYVDLVLGDGLEMLRCIDELGIAMNPPYLPGDRLFEGDEQFISGPMGVELLEKVLKRLENCRGWVLLTIVSSLSNYEDLIRRWGGIKIDSLPLEGEELYLIVFRR